MLERSAIATQHEHLHSQSRSAHSWRRLFHAPTNDVNARVECCVAIGERKHMKTKTTKRCTRKPKVSQFDLTLKSLTEKYPNDPSAPGVVLVWLPKRSPNNCSNRRAPTRRRVRSSNVHFSTKRFGCCSLTSECGIIILTMGAHLMCDNAV